MVSAAVSVVWVHYVGQHVNVFDSWARVFVPRSRVT